MSDLSQAAHIQQLRTTCEVQKASLEFIERWAVYKRFKPDGKNLAAEEALMVIVSHPAIRAITQRFEGNGEIDMTAYHGEAVRSAARVLLAAMQEGRCDPFDACDPAVEQLAIEHSNEGGDAVIVLETAEKFMLAGLAALCRKGAA